MPRIALLDPKNLPPGIKIAVNTEVYQKLTGLQPPEFQPERPVKKWYLDTPYDPAPYSFAYFKNFSADGTAQTGETMVSAAWARTVNLPGSRNYPSYATWTAQQPPVKHTNTFQFFDEVPQTVPIQLDVLAYRSQAEEIAQRIGQGAFVREVAENQSTGKFNYDSTDERRAFDVVVIGSDGHTEWGFNAGRLFKDAAIKGVGAPGKWMLINSLQNGMREPLWVPAVTPVASATLGEVPYPVRWPLQPGERFAQGLMGDVGIEMAEAPASAGSGFSAEDRALIVNAARKTLAG